jgi:hypothetical protein
MKYPFHSTCKVPPYGNRYIPHAHKLGLRVLWGELGDQGKPNWRKTALGEQRRKALELVAPPPSRHDHSDGDIPRSFEQAFHNRCRKSVEPIRPIEC